MKKIFNNPWFIVCLSAGAIAYLVVSVVLPLFEDDGTELAGSVPIFDLGGGAEPGVARDSLPLGDRAVLNGALGSRTDITWLDAANHDPFSVPTLAERDVVEPVLPTVGALFVGAGRQSAVLNDRLVRVGDRVEGYRVTYIDASHVIVERDRRSYRLEPDV